MDCLFFEQERPRLRRWLVIYDISDDRRRARFAKLLEGYGERVQKSAFECRLSPAAYRELTLRIETMVGESDSVRVYSVPGAAEKYGNKKNDHIGSDVVILFIRKKIFGLFRK